MTHNRFDQASRYAGKLDAVGFLSWLLRDPPAALGFAGWLDTRTLPFPGDPERTCDTVAALCDPEALDEWAVPVEFSLEPDALLFGRLLVYLGQLWLELRPGGDGGTRYRVGAIVVNLTGKGATSRDFVLRQTGIRTCLQAVERNLAEEDAAATLTSIAAGTVARCVLPWIPLMRGGGEPAIIEQWKQLAVTEADPRKRSDFGGLAVVFAEAANRLVVWKEALKEWNMIESQQVLEWMTEGEAKGEAKVLLRYLAKQFPPGPPSDLAAMIRASKDPDELMRWFDAALAAPSLDAFRQALNGTNGHK